MTDRKAHEDLLDAAVTALDYLVDQIYDGPEGPCGGIIRELEECVKASEKVLGIKGLVNDA
jgi:hypothetical protein